jgi:hypothetical protein
LELETGTVISFSSEVPSGHISVTICGDVQENVNRAQCSIQATVAAALDLQRNAERPPLIARRRLLTGSPAVVLGAGTTGTSTATLLNSTTPESPSAALARELFEAELKLLMEDENQSERLAQELQQSENQRESEMRREEEEGARLAFQLFEKEANDHTMHERSVILSKKFFEQLPAGFTTCPKCRWARPPL